MPFVRTRLILLTVGMLLAACGGEDNTTFGSGGSGGSGGTTPTGSGGDGASSTGGAAACVDFGEPCSACELAACEGRYCGCYENVDCGLYASCALECDPTDTDCLQACNTAFPNGITDAVLLNDCAATSCTEACAQFPLYALTPCQTCLYENCETSMNACLAIADCAALLFCLNDCAGDQTCQTTCYATYPDGVTPATPVGACSSQECAAQCGGG